MQKYCIILLLAVLTSCRSDVRYFASNAMIDRMDTTFNVRIDVDLLETKTNAQLGLLVHSFGAFEVYWDSVKIGQNGVPATAKRIEVPGTEASYYQIPDKLSSSGRHVVTMRGSQSYMRDVDRSIIIVPESFQNLLRQPLLELSFVNLMAGAFLIAAIYFTFLYYNSKYKQHTTLLFAIVCLLFFALLTMEYLKYYIDIPYTQFYLRLSIVGWLNFTISILIPLYFIIHFNVPYKKFSVGLLIAVLLIIYIINYGHYDFTTYLYSLTLWIASVLILLYAFLKKQRGSAIVLAGFVVSMVINQFVIYDFGLYIAFTIILLCILYLQTIGAKQMEEEHQASLLLSSRLKLELIKKNIQPHFLRNTLTSLIDWVEEAPAQGVLFIEALSKEFDVMNEIADQTLIPIRQEIALCRHHLSVMQFRKEIKYNWEDAAIQDDESIPPAIIHTMLENGISHSMPNEDGSMLFRLSFSKDDRYKQYVFEVFAHNRMKSEHPGGNGFRYIEARLKESYGDKWKFSSEPFSGGWRNVIRLEL